MTDADIRIELITKRLHLRKFEVSDSKYIVKLLKNKEVPATTLNLPYPCSIDQANQIISEYKNAEKNGEALRWVITVKDTNEFIGGIRLVPNKIFNSAELGFWLGKAFWQHGYAFEAAAEVIEFAFNTLAINRLEAHAMVENTPSIRLLEKLGFSKEGLHPELVIKWGNYKDVVTFGFLKKNYGS